MELRVLDRDAALGVYTQQMTRDFPAEELKPFYAVEELMQAGLYEPLAFYEGGALAAYAWQVALPGADCALIDYFAVLRGRRGGGMGTAVLAQLQAYYAPCRRALLVESEHPAEAPDPAAARRRIGFYLRAGARFTAMESRLFGVRYQILALPCGGAAVSAVDVHRELQALYRAMVPEPYYRGNVIFYGC